MFASKLFLAAGQTPAANGTTPQVFNIVSQHLSNGDHKESKYIFSTEGIIDYAKECENQIPNFSIKS